MGRQVQIIYTIYTIFTKLLYSIYTSNNSSYIQIMHAFYNVLQFFFFILFVRIYQLEEFFYTYRTYFVALHIYVYMYLMLNTSENNKFCIISTYYTKNKFILRFFSFPVHMYVCMLNHKQNKKIKYIKKYQNLRKIIEALTFVHPLKDVN